MVLVHPGVVKTCILICTLISFCTGNIPLNSYWNKNTNNDNSIFEIISKKANNSTECTDDCNEHGTCNSGKCECYLFYSGSTCETRWRSDKDWFLFWNLLVALVILLFSILSILFVWYFIKNYLKFRDKDWRDWPISIYVMLLGFIAAFVRVVYFAIDPISERNILPRPAGAILLNITLILGQCCVFMLFLYWLELGQAKSARMPQNLEKFKPVLIVLVVLTVALCFPILIASQVNNSTVLLGIYNLVMAVDCLVVFVMVLAAGIRLLVKLKSIQSFSQKHAQSGQGEEDVITIFIHKIRWYLLLMGFALLTFTVTLPIYVLSNAQTEPWVYLRFQLVLRVCEFIYGITVLLLLVRRKRPFGGSRSGSRKSENISAAIPLSASGGNYSQNG